MEKNIIFGILILLFSITFALAVPKLEAPITGGGGVSTITFINSNITNFTQLLDAPNSYSGNASNCVLVNAGATGLTFGSCSAGSGDITSVQGDIYLTNGSNSGAVILRFNDTQNNITIGLEGLRIGFNSTHNQTTFDFIQNLTAYKCQSGFAMNGTYSNGTASCIAVSSSGAVNVFNQDLNTTNNVKFGNVTSFGNITVARNSFFLANVTASVGGWFNGLFNWIVGSNPSARYLTFNGSTLDFSETNLNGTIDSRINLGGGDNRSWNQSFANTLYANISWNYNQTTTSLPLTSITGTDSNNCSGTDKVKNVSFINGDLVIVCDTDQTGTGNPFNQVLNTTSNVTFANITVTKGITIGENVTANWFKGLFNWIIGSNPSARYLTFNGSTLDFNEVNLNATIDNRATGNASLNESYLNTLYCKLTGCSITNRLNVSGNINVSSGGNVSIMNGDLDFYTLGEGINWIQLGSYLICFGTGKCELLNSGDIELESTDGAINFIAGVINTQGQVNGTNTANFLGNIFGANITSTTNRFCNATQCNTLADFLNDTTSAGGTFNATYDIWAYNQTIPAITDINSRFWNITQSWNRTQLYNISEINNFNASWIATHNQSYFSFQQNQSAYQCSVGFVGNGTYTNGTIRCIADAIGSGGVISNSSLNLIYLNLSGTNANQNISIGIYNFTSTGTGFWGFLGSVAGRISKLWATDGDFSGFLNVTKNYTTQNNSRFCLNGDTCTSYITHNGSATIIT